VLWLEGFLMCGYELKNGAYHPTPEYLRQLADERSELAKREVLFARFEAVANLEELSLEDLRLYVAMLRAARRSELWARLTWD